MNWQLVQLSEVLPHPWRNAAGVTRELVAWPDSANWLWRMSVAEVGDSGPFSSFEGVQRWFAVLDGAGLRLTVGQSTHQLTAASEPLCFDGAIPVVCNLLNGATQDFNLMVRSEQCTGWMQRVSGETCVTFDTPKILAIYANDTRATLQNDQKSLLVPARSLAWCVVPGGAAVQLNSAGALWMEIDV